LTLRRSGGVRQDGAAYLNFDDELLASQQRVHCANGYNLNGHGSWLLGEALARWLLDELRRRPEGLGSPAAGRLVGQS
jgi:hypothetical protein